MKPSARGSSFTRTDDEEALHTKRTEIARHAQEKGG